MAPRSQRLEPILQLKQRQQDDVARQVAERDRVLAEQQERLEALQRYADEYSAPPVAATTINPALLANRMAFRAKLEQAVEHQSRIVDSNRERCDVERARLLLASREKHVMEKLAASYRAAEERVADQKTQRELDDLGARRVRNAASGNTTP